MNIHERPAFPVKADNRYIVTVHLRFSLVCKLLITMILPIGTFLENYWIAN